MMLSAAPAAAQEPDYDIGPNGADVPHVIADDFVVAPLVDRLFNAEREPEINRAREILLRPIEPMDRQQFFGPQDTKCLKELRPNFVLSTIAARRRDQRRPHPPPVAHHREERIVFIVWMRRGLHERPGRGELSKLQPQRDIVGQLSYRPYSELRRNRCRNEKKGDRGEKNAKRAHNGIVVRIERSQEKGEGRISLGKTSFLPSPV